MYYEIINPSDKCFFKADGVAVAGLVTVLLGNGQYAAKPETEGAPEVPFFMFGGLDAWWDAHGDGQPLEGAVDRHKAAIIECLRSVCYGSLEDRRMFEDALALIDDPQKKAKFVAQWNDRYRTSLNDIMGRAHAYAEKLAKA
jgi:hypothetical protein